MEGDDFSGAGFVLEDCGLGLERLTDNLAGLLGDLVDFHLTPLFREAEESELRSFFFLEILGAPISKVPQSETLAIANYLMATLGL